MKEVKVINFQERIKEKEEKKDIELTRLILKNTKSF